MEKIVLLLEYHKILAPLPQHREAGNKTYFMPCVLKSATPADLQKVHGSPHIAPLMIRYKCGYMPLGVFSSLIIELVSHHHNWTLIEENPCRNKVEFLVGKEYDTVTLVSRPTFMEVVLFKKFTTTRPAFSICEEVRDTIKTALEDVHSYLKYHSTAEFQYGFECPSHPGKEHLCVLPEQAGNTLLCLLNHKSPVPLRMNYAKYRVWFHKVREE